MLHSPRPSWRAFWLQSSFQNNKADKTEFKCLLESLELSKLVKLFIYRSHHPSWRPIYWLLLNMSLNSIAESQMIPKNDILTQGNAIKIRMFIFMLLIHPDWNYNFMIIQKEDALWWNYTMGFAFCSAFWLVCHHSRVAPVAGNGEKAITYVRYLVTRAENPVSKDHRGKDVQ